VLVREVPALVCGDCGEAYLEGPMVDRLLSIVRELQQMQAEVSIVRYKAA